MNHHIKSVRFTTKIREIRNIWPGFSNSGDNTVESQLCNFSCKPPFYLPNSSPVQHISMHAYSVGWHLSCYRPPSQPRLLPYFPLVHVVCKCVACFFDYTYVCNLCSYDCFKQHPFQPEQNYCKEILF